MADRFTAQVLNATADLLTEQPARTIDGTDLMRTLLAAADTLTGTRTELIKLRPACEALPLLGGTPETGVYISQLRAAADALLVA